MPGRGRLAIRRLRIIDVETGSQPVFNEDESVVVVLNGEIYNYRELTTELAAKGHTFRTRADTEVLVHGYEEEGADFIKRCNGMFAFALYDKRKGRLLLARDRFGKKPLYYLLHKEGLLFASEIKALLPHPWMERNVDEASLCDYLTFGYVPEGRCILTGVQKLLPGHTLQVDTRSGRHSFSAYWVCPLAEEEGYLREEECLERFRSLFSEAVRLRMRSDVPVGAFLSGGVDSSSVVAEMASFTDVEQLHTFSVGLDSRKHDESPYALQAASRFRTIHHNEILTGKEALSLLPVVVEAFDEPLADSSLLPTTFVARLAREHVTVVLSGDGGDEMLCGYDQFALAPYWERLQGLPRPKQVQMLLSLWWHRQKAASYVRRFLSLNHQDPAVLLHQMLTSGSLLRACAMEEKPAEPLSRIAALTAHSRARHPARRMQDYYLHFYLPGDILPKVDRASMANSLEVRCPFLDFQLASFLASIPSERLLRPREKKLILRQWGEGRLPSDILSRKKRGFSVPLRSWFRTSWRELLHDILGSPHLLAKAPLSPLALKPREAFALLMLELWYRRFVQGQPLRVWST